MVAVAEKDALASLMVPEGVRSATSTFTSAMQWKTQEQKGAQVTTLTNDQRKLTAVRAGSGLSCGLGPGLRRHGLGTGHSLVVDQSCD